MLYSYSLKKKKHQSYKFWVLLFYFFIFCGTKRRSEEKSPQKVPFLLMVLYNESENVKSKKQEFLGAGWAAFYTNSLVSFLEMAMQTCILCIFDCKPK